MVRPRREGGDVVYVPFLLLLLLLPGKLKVVLHIRTAGGKGFDWDPWGAEGDICVSNHQNHL